MDRASRVAAAVAAGVLILAAPVAAQQAPQLVVGESFTVAFNHDGQYTHTYRVTISGPTPYTADLPASALANGEVLFRVPAGLPTIGQYTVVATAIGDGGQTPSDPFAFAVGAPAPAKGTVRIERGVR